MISEIFWNIDEFRYELFRYCETTIFWRKNVILLPSVLPLLIHKIFWYQKVYETKKGSYTNFFCTVRQQIFDEKSWYSSALSTEIGCGIDICKNSLKTNIETVVLFLTICKSWSKYLKLVENYAGASRQSCPELQPILREELANKNNKNLAFESSHGPKV